MDQTKRINLNIKAADALTFEADVLVLKHAQAFYGLDAAVAELLATRYHEFSSLLPKISGFRLLESRGVIACSAVLFVGVASLRQFGYGQIREFGRKALVSLAGAAPQTRHLCLTIHGPGYGLDEIEAFESELAGVLDAIENGDFPEALEQITVVERNAARANRLQAAMDRLLPNGFVEVGAAGEITKLAYTITEHLTSVGYSSENKRHIFVAMPFAEEMDDTFHYGIQPPVKAAGFLCERADLSVFTGDVLDWVKKRIASSALVIADLSTANPNVYLEVGFAWGCGRPTILLCRNRADLKFDVQSQRCVIYKKIRDLEESLHKALEHVRDQLVSGR